MCIMNSGIKSNCCNQDPVEGIAMLPIYAVIVLVAGTFAPVVLHLLAFAKIEEDLRNCGKMRIYAVDTSNIIFLLGIIGGVSGLLIVNLLSQYSSVPTNNLAAIWPSIVVLELPYSIYKYWQARRAVKKTPLAWHLCGR